MICRWNYKGITVDVMPTDPSILGFSNPWYFEGMKNTQEVALGDGQIIRILSLPYFIASKLEASSNRGSTDLRFDSDLEDVALVVDGHNDPASEIASGGAEVMNYLTSRFSNLLAKEDFKEALVGFLDHEGQGRVDSVIALLESIAER